MSPDMAPSQPRRTWPQRLTFVTVILAAIACFATAGGLAAGQWVLSQRKLITIDPNNAATAAAGGGTGGVVVPGASTTLPGSPNDPSAPTTTIFLAEPDAANFLVVGADTGGCSDQVNTADRSDLGERSDTIMVWRANPEINQLAVLSFPRDLYVDIRGRKDRINASYKRDDPSKMIEVLRTNFGVPVDHYVQVDFCAFRQLVEAVDGVEVPFEYPARDASSGLVVTNTGCVNLDGDQALSYVRSRKYQYEDPPGSGTWKRDNTSDFGRIARQQDFLRRVVTKVINDGLYSPDVAGALITTNREYLVTDTGLTVRRLLEFANTLRSLNPADITTYRIESSTLITSGGADVQVPRVQGDNMQAILSVFRGEATLGEAPDQVFESTTTIAPRTTTTTVPATTEPTTPTETTDVVAETVTTTSSTSSSTTSSTTLPTIEAEENTVGIVPDRNAVCD